MSIQQTTEEKHYTFFDAASPTFMLVNSEVAEGDLIEAFPNFAKNLALFTLTGAFVGMLGYLWSNRPVPPPPCRNCGFPRSTCTRWTSWRPRRPSANRSTA